MEPTTEVRYLQTSTLPGPCSTRGALPSGGKEMATMQSGKPEVVGEKVSASYPWRSLRERTSLQRRMAFGSPPRARGRHFILSHTYLRRTSVSPSMAMTERRVSPCVRMVHPCSFCAQCTSTHPLPALRPPLWSQIHEHPGTAQLFGAVGESWIERYVHCGRRGESLLITASRFLVLSPPGPPA